MKLVVCDAVELVDADAVEPGAMDGVIAGDTQWISVFDVRKVNVLVMVQDKLLVDLVIVPEELLVGVSDANVLVMVRDELLVGLPDAIELVGSEKVCLRARRARRCAVG